jgi:hypothetical protein
MIVPYLIYVICVELLHAAGSLGFLRRRDGNYTTFRVMGVMDCLPSCLAMSVGLMLLTCSLGPHS